MKGPASQVSQAVSATVDIRDEQVQRRVNDPTASTQQRENPKRFDRSDNANNANGRRRPDAESKMNTKSAQASASAPIPPSDAEPQPVPHVVRVTFLGVAGILASPLSPSTQTRHPSLLFPAPEALRVVATVSRTRTARGIPSGVSACLERASLRDGDSSAGLNGASALDAHQVLAAATSPAPDPAPPSRFLHARTNSRGGREGGANSGARSDAAAAATTANARCSSFSLKLDETQGSIEITASNEAMIDANDTLEGDDRDRIEALQSSENAQQKQTIDATATTRNNADAAAVNQQPQTHTRCLAVWEQDAPRRKEATAVAHSKTNTLAFEAELHPSSRTKTKTPTRDQNSNCFGTFAPKTFCVTVGLVPDIFTNDTDSTLVNKDADEKNSRSSGSSGSNTDTSLPAFAIPIGFANLVINGEETLDGQSLQLDLPLTSLNHFIGNFGHDTTAAGATQFNDGQSSDFPFPLIELGNGGDINESSQPAPNKLKVGDEEQDKSSLNTNDTYKKPTVKIKPIKKSMVSRIFSRNRHGSNKATNAPTNIQQTIPPESHKEDSGQPLSIFQLGRPPNAKERTMFLERYNIDPSGDAVIRIALEVFQRGSELERVFRQRNRMRREQRRRETAAAAAAAAETDSICVGVPPNSHNDVERTSSSGTGHSLVDDDDFMESDSNSEETQSCFSLDSERSGATWDESTFYTNETFGSYYSEADTSYYSSDFMTDSVVERGSRTQNSVFGRMFDCKLDGVEGDNPRNNPTASKQHFPIQLQSILNLNCAGGGPSRQRDLYEYEEPRGLVPSMYSSGSAVSNSTPMVSHDARRAKAARQGRIGVADDHRSEGTGNEFTPETTMDQAFGDPSRNVDRTYTVGTVGNEESSIVQRATQAVNSKDRAQSSETVPSDVPAGQSHDEAEGLELTLEEVSHQRSL